MVYVNRAGVLSRRRNLEAMLREEWERNRTATLDEIERRQNHNPPIPLSDKADGSSPLQDPGEFEPGDGWGELEVVLRVLHPAEAEVYDFMAAEAHDLWRARGESTPWRELVDVNEAFREAWRHIVRCAVVEVHGLHDDGGAYSLRGGLSSADIEALERANLLVPLSQAARSFQHLSEEERGNCGALQPSTTSAATTAAPAPRTKESASAATATPPPSGLAELEGGDTPAAHAPDASQTSTHGLVELASSTTRRGAA